MQIVGTLTAVETATKVPTRGLDFGRFRGMRTLILKGFFRTVGSTPTVATHIEGPIVPSKSQSVIDPSKARGGHPFHMFDAITAQPAAIAEVVARNREGVTALARALKETPALTLPGPGTSLTGATCGEYW